MIVTGDYLGLKLLSALGIEASNVTKVELVCDVGRAARVVVTSLVAENASENVKTLLESYTVASGE